MEFINTNYRFTELKNGDVCVCHLEECNWNQTNICLAVYFDGQFYDIMVKEDNMMPHENLMLADDNNVSMVKEFSFTGDNVDNLDSPVLM